MPRYEKQLEEENVDVFGSIVNGIWNLFGTGACERKSGDARKMVGRRDRSPTGPPRQVYMADFNGTRRNTSPTGSRTGSAASMSRTSSASSNTSGDMSVFGSKSFIERRSPSAERSGNTTPKGSSKATAMEKALKLENNKLYKAKWRSFELFKLLDDADMNSCIDRMKVRTYASGDTIIERGSIGTTMYFMDLGTARAEIRGQTATELKSGDYFGEIAFAATCNKFLRDKSDTSPSEQAVRVADVKATCACRTLELSVKDFLTVLKENNKEQNRNILASLAKTSDERKANARRINAKQRTESRRRSKEAREAWDGLSMEEATKQLARKR